MKKARCWDCADIVAERITEFSRRMVGCKRNLAITDYESAQISCPFVEKTDATT